MADNTKLYNLTIYTPYEVFFNDKVQAVSIPSVQGQFQVLINHAPIVAKIDAGIVIIRDSKDTEHRVEVKNGFAELKRNNLAIAISSAINI